MVIISQDERTIVNMNNGLIFTNMVSVNYRIDGENYKIGTYGADRTLEVVKSIYTSYKNGYSTYEMPKE